MTNLKTRAIVLRRTNYGETDRILQLLTPEGKVSVIARGVRKEKSRLSGGIELLAISDVVIGSGKGDLSILTSARLVQFFEHIMEDYSRLQFAYDAIKSIARASEMIDEPDWYEVLAEMLGALDDIGIQLELIEAWFYLHYAALMGHELNLATDINGDTLSADKCYRYDDNEKGLAEFESGRISSDHIKLMRLIATKNLKNLAQIGGIKGILPECASVALRHAAVK